MARLVALVPEGHELVERTNGVELAVYVDRTELVRLRAELPQLAATAVESGWEDAWKAFHRPVTIGPLWIGPSWEQPPSDRLAVVIEPGRAFGTGGHATTRLCLELLVRLERGSLLDVGCGSGVLAIAAARLGYAPVTAVDVDDASVEATRANALANGVAVDVRCADALTELLPAVDVAVANIELAAVEALASRLRCDRLVLSGYPARDRPAILGFRHVERRTEAGWAADVYARE